MLHSYTIPWKLARCLSSARQRNSAHYLQLGALILSKSSRRVSSTFRNKRFNIPSNTTIRWIKIDQLEVTCFIISLFTAQHVSNVSTSIFRSLRLICWVISWVVLLWFDVCWCYGVVRLKLKLKLKPASGYHTTPVEPHRNTNTYRTRAIQPMK